MFDFFDFSGFPARWHCGDWSATLGWLTITSDLVIFAAYTAIPLTIALYVKRRGDVPFPHVFWLFCAFIFSCGTTHLIEAVIFWYPIYPVQGVLKCLTAVVSIAAVVATARIMPAALAVPGMAALNRQLQAEVAARGASQDELRQRTAQLQESERRLLAAQAAARIGDWTFDQPTQQISWSAEIFRLFERDPALGPPRSFAENLAQYTAQGAAALSGAMARIEAGESRVSIDLEVDLPSGGIAWHHSIMHAEHAADGRLTCLWGTVQDITAKKLEGLEAIARMASGVAHEYNNLNAVVLAALKRLQQRIGGDPETDQLMPRILGTIERSRRISKSLLTLGRQPVPTTIAIDLRARVADITALLTPQAQRAGATLLLSSDEGRLPVLIDANDLHQVLSNLVINALHAIHQSAEPLITVQLRREQDDVMLTVGDNGVGIAPADLPLVFQPFFSRKGAHDHSGRFAPHVHGAGLGLALCQTLVERAGGTLGLTSVPGAGTTATIRLPLALTAVVEPLTPAQPTAPSVAQESIHGLVVVDDNQDLCVLLDAELRDAGFAVSSYSDPAVFLAEVRTLRFTALVLDWKMPGIYGAEVLEQLADAQRAVPLKVVIMSGEVPKVPSPMPAGLILHAVLAKPFLMADLLKLLQRM